MMTLVEGTIIPGEAYTLNEAKRRLGIKSHVAWQAWKRKGLRAVRIGRVRYVRADDILRVLATQPTEEPASAWNESTAPRADRTA